MQVQCLQLLCLLHISGVQLVSVCASTCKTCIALCKLHALALRCANRLVEQV
jgi:hypothetical protein